MARGSVGQSPWCVANPGCGAMAGNAVTGWSPEFQTRSVTDIESPGVISSTSVVASSTTPA